MSEAQAPKNPLSHVSDTSEYDRMPDIEKLQHARNAKMLAIYRTVAEVMPLEGRDYEIDMSWGSETDARLVFKMRGLNPLGIAFANAVVDYIKEKGLVK